MIIEKEYFDMVFFRQVGEDPQRIKHNYWILNFRRYNLALLRHYHSGNPTVWTDCDLEYAKCPWCGDSLSDFTLFYIIMEYKGRSDRPEFNTLVRGYLNRKRKIQPR